MTEQTVETSGCCTCDTLVFCLFLFGAYKLLFFLYEIISPFVTPRLDLLKRYGKGWALVTGGSEGIGLAIAEELARQGFNLVLMSRSIDKLREARESLLKVREGVQVEVKSVDFEQLLTEEDYKACFADYLKKDVSVLVNNVGIYYPRFFDKLSFEQIRRELKVNLIPISILSSLFIPKMLERPARSGIINLSSGGSVISYTGNAHYSATKKFDDNLSLALAYEYGHKIDILTARPYFITTRATNFTDSFMHTSSKTCAKRLVDSLGRRAVSYGTFLHTFQGVGTLNVNDRILSPVYGFALDQYTKLFDSAAK